MADNDTLASEERQAYLIRYGEYQRIPVVRYGPFRVDRERHRHASFAPGEHELPSYYLVFEVEASSEFELVVSWSAMAKLWGGAPPAWPIPSRAEIVQLVKDWLQVWSPALTKGKSSLAWYRRRVGALSGTDELTPGEWHIPPLFRRPNSPMIAMEEGAPLVKAALCEVEHADAGGEVQE
jgi:hypothetical protein